MKSISNDNIIDQCNNPKHNTASDRTTNYDQRNKQPISQKFPPESPQKMPRRSARISKREQHQANRLYIHPNTNGNVQPGFFRRRGNAPRQQLRGGRVPRDLELPMGHPTPAHHYRRVAQPPVQAKVPDCFRCQTGHPPATSTAASLITWNEDLRM